MTTEVTRLVRNCAVQFDRNTIGHIYMSTRFIGRVRAQHVREARAE